jgi:hypothetical protein
VLWRARQSRRAQQLRNSFAHLDDPLRSAPVTFRNSDRAASDSEEIQNFDMLHCLRHYAVISRYDKQGEVYSTDACQHVAHKAFVTRHIDETDRRAIVGAPISKSEIDGDATSSLLGQTVRLNTSQGPDQRSLAVIDVASGSD